ncbi:MAG TPA: DUF4241 domain-containing protein [Sphingobacterium sp.]|nr:DUF4241 domain-containing protein [Sphingobacterium sp.]
MKKNRPENDSDTSAKSIDFDLTDTIPLITIQDKSLAIPQIFEGSFKSETAIKQIGSEITFDVIPVGNLKISSGKIIATDPVTLSDAIAFENNFPIGEFPVELAMANIKLINDRRVAFARLKFSDNPVKKWEFALLPGQSPIDIKSTGVYGYGVDSGLGLFIDQEAMNNLNTILDENWENIFSEKFKDYTNYDFQDQNVIFFSTGYGDGFYATYIGKDSDGKICQLLTDFGIVMWWNLDDQVRLNAK